MAGGTRGSDRVAGATPRGAYLVEGADGALQGVVWRRGHIWYHQAFDPPVHTPSQGTTTREDAIRRVIESA